MVLCKDQVQIKLPTEGFQLAHLEQNFLEKGEPIDHFWFVFIKLYKPRNFDRGDLRLAPFAARQIGHSWFKQARVIKGEGKEDAQKIVDNLWSNFLSAIPAPYSLDKRDQICLLNLNSMKEIESIIARNKEALKYYKPTDCKSSNFVTKGHIKWWDAYYKQFDRSLKEINEGIQRTCNAIAATEKAPQKRKAYPSKQTSKRVRGSSKASSATSNPQEDLLQKSVSSSTRLPTIEDSQQDSGVSPKEHLRNRKKFLHQRSADQVHQPINEKNHSPPVVREETLISSSKGYSPSPEYMRNLSPEKIDALIDQDAATRIISAQVQNVDISGVQVNDTLCAQNTSNPLNSTTEGGNDSLVLLHNSDNSKSKNAQIILKSKRLTSQIPIVIENDSDLEDLVKVISEAKAGSSQGISPSEAKSIQQEKPTTPISEKIAEIAKMRLESTTNKLLISAVEKMIQLLSHLIYEIQNNEELTFELTRVSSYLVENQFPQEYKKKVKFFNVIFSNLIKT
ncbi:hypothetical protein PIB30_036671 [Stylosanthes scabra]|uniref:Uncharacterized protein n=1 Tax=Stylosanthes scabra TaxID=79078 RepID=A0ABU6WEQ5_9FABA|nr:hypothetical protein [Stylosanthes scabra]